jgi:hypothetical protein
LSERTPDLFVFSEEEQRLTVYGNAV